MFWFHPLAEFDLQSGHLYGCGNRHYESIDVFDAEKIKLKSVREYKIIATLKYVANTYIA